MSVKLMGAVFDLPLEQPQRKLLLLALANYANDQGRCWPTQVRLAADACLSERRLRDHLHGLEADGWLSVLVLGNGRGKPTEYLLNADRILAIKAEKADEVSGLSPFSQKAEKADVSDLKADVSAQKADVSDPKGGQPTPDDPSGSVSRSTNRSVRESDAREKPVPLPQKTVVTEEWVSEEREAFVSTLPGASFDEAVRFAMNSSYFKSRPDKRAYVHGQLERAAERRAERNGNGKAPRGSAPRGTLSEADLDQWERYARREI